MKMQFLKRMLDILPEDELLQITNLASKCKKRRKRREKKFGESVSAPEELLHSVSVPEEPIKSGWFRRFGPADILALDVEKIDVPLQNTTSKKKFQQKAAKVTVVNYEEEIVYQATIWRADNTYRVTSHTQKINGIKQNSLQIESHPKIDEVKKSLEQIMGEKLIVGINLLQDFQSLDLAMGDFQTFDLNCYWWRRTLNRDNVYVREDLGLRSLCKYYFFIDMQPDHAPHSDYVDAVWTMRLFRDVYMKIDPEPDFKNNHTAMNAIEHFGNLYK